MLLTTIFDHSYSFIKRRNFQFYCHKSVEINVLDVKEVWGAGA